MQIVVRRNYIFMYEEATKEIIMAQNNNEEAMTNIIEKNSGLIWSIVKRFMGRGYSRRRVISSWSNADL